MTEPALPLLPDQVSQLANAVANVVAAKVIAALKGERAEASGGPKPGRRSERPDTTTNGEFRSWPSLLTVREAAEFSGYSPSTVRAWIKEGRLRRVPRVKRCIGFQDLVMFMDSRRQCPERWRHLLGGGHSPKNT